jgi:hypothetical protein
MPPAGIAKYHVVDFGTVKGAVDGAAALIAHINSPRGLRHLTGPRRAVIYGERSDESQFTQAKLYLSDGALEAAREVNLTFKQLETLAAEQLPGSALLIHGQP